MIDKAFSSATRVTQEMIQDLVAFVAGDAELSPYHEEEDIEKLIQALGAPPLPGVHLYVRGSQALFALAKRMTDEMKRRWGGCRDLDWLSAQP